MIIYMMITGWLFDVYPLGNKMVIWIKQKNGSSSSSGNSIVRLEDTNWNYSLYVSADDKSDLVSILKQPEIIEQVKEHEFVLKHERITDNEKSNILKLKLRDPTKALTLAKKIERLDSNFGKLRLYNVDLSPSQLYFYEHDIFPLAFCKACSNSSSSSSSHSKLSWNNKDDAWSVDYQIPDFKTIHMSLNLKNGEGRMMMMPRYTDRISSIRIKQQDSDIIEIQSESEADIIENLIKVVKKIDPDFIFTEDGDSFTFPYLIHRAEINNTDLFLGREESIPLRKPTREGTSYFSYGQVYFKPATIKLLGRIHLDKSNSFMLNETTAAGLHGLYEIARICRMPLHTASRASIGKCLSSLQFYYATTQKDTLIPWKPVTAEHFKSLQELLVADRGGFIFEPEIGVHENVAEFDFVSLYPNIMFKKNLSAETILCGCCPSSKLRVPDGLRHNICERRVGLVPMSLKIVLDKRKKYKQLLKKYPDLPYALKKTIYDSRQNALKWILVTSFGYLGFNNAKFGRIDAHIAVCVFDRQILLQAAKIAERYGFRVLHGIVDSIWIKKKTTKDDNDNNNTDNIDAQDYLKLK